MKRLFKYFSIVLVGALFFNSCETSNLDLSDDPNSLIPSQADPDFYLNAVEINFARLVESMGTTAAEVTRIQYMGSRNYQNAYSPSSFSTNWERAYQETLKNISDMNTLAEEAELTKHIAIGQFIEAYTMTLLVDFFGDVPYSQALLGADNLNPAVDDGADIYAAALTLLDKAIVNFNTDALADPQYDFYYDGDYDNWIKACNTLKLKLYITTGNISAFNSIIASGDYIDNTNEDLQFTWGSNQVQPDTRHPAYADGYTDTGVGTWQSIWLMNMMDTSNDPRIRYYFYRQVATVPGSDGTDPDEQNLACSLQSAPAHYVSGGYPFCTLPNGYWGRNHGNNEGSPPDGFLKTATGVYPAAGMFDDDRFEPVSLGGGGGGAGITPILLASSVNFWQAEVAMISSPAAGAPFILEATSKSIAKVMSFGSLDPEADLTFAPTEDDINAYAAAIEDSFNAANDTGKWNIMAKQYFISLKGNGIDAYNFYRREGYPTDIEPNLEPDPGAFIRSFYYPANFANNNSSVDQKSTVTQQVFWDTNPASPTFPVGN